MIPEKIILDTSITSDKNYTLLRNDTRNNNGIFTEGNKLHDINELSSDDIEGAEVWQMKTCYTR